MKQSATENAKLTFAERKDDEVKTSFREQPTDKEECERPDLVFPNAGNLHRISRIHFGIFQELLTGPRTAAKLRGAFRDDGYEPSRQAFHSTLKWLRDNHYIHYGDENRRSYQLTARGRTTWHLTLRHYIEMGLRLSRSFPFEVDFSGIDELGTHTQQAFLTDQLLAASSGEYEGDPLTAFSGEVIFHEDHDGEYRSDWCIEIDEGVSFEPSGPFQFLNHSCSPNCEIQVSEDAKAEDPLKRYDVHLVALRDIQAGEELTFDYGCDSNEALPPTICRCNNPECRGFIVAEDSVAELYLELVHWEAKLRLKYTVPEIVLATKRLLQRVEQQ